MFPLKTNNPSQKFPFITILLIALNFFLFLHEVFLGSGFPVFVKKYGCIPYEITHFIDLDPYINFSVYFTLFTSIFLHGSWLHLLGNMWFLYIFGRNVEDWLGNIRFLLFYLGCGVAASLIQVLFHPMSKIPTVGASGAIAGVLGAYLILYPGSKIVCLVPFFFFIRIVALPAFLFLGFWIVWQVFSQMTLGGATNIAFLAHIGGFFIGFFGVRWLKLRKWGGWR